METTTTVAAALERARERFIAANPASRAAHDDAVRVLPGGNTRSTLYYSPFPLVMRSGRGAEMTDLDGHTYIDLLGEYTAGLYGHSNPIIRGALDAALDAGWNFGAQGEAEARLAGVLCARFPSLELVRFTNSGTEANLLALATAVAHTGRRRVLVFDGAYHGSILSFGGGGLPINAPHDWVVGTYNDPAGIEALVRQHGPDLAAILVEPMLGSGGCIPADRSFLAGLRAAADETGAVLIFDEVMTSRMSEGGQQLRLGITPDLTTLGKYLGGGMTFGAFGGRADIMSLFDPRAAGSVPHAGTFNNNVLSLAAGYAGLTRIFDAAASEALFDTGEQLRHRLNELCRRHGAAMQWTGLGSLTTVHFQSEPIAAAKDLRPRPDLAELFHLELLHRGFFLARRGMVALSLEVGARERDDFCAAVAQFLDETPF